MKKLTYLGKELDPNKEIELISMFINGYKVTVKYSAHGNYGHISDQPIIFNNVSEFHNQWRKGSIAIESDDIHYTGRINELSDIDWIKIEMAENVEEVFSNYNQ